MAVTTAIAGRRRELPAVAGVLTGGTDAVAMLVAGEAGVGKSRLVAAAGAVAAQADVTVLTGWCLPMSQGLPLLPVVDLLRGFGELDKGRLLDSVLSDCPAFVRGEVVRLLPELDASGAETRPAEADDGWRRQRLFDALRQLLSAVAKVRRAAVVVEDVQWADATTLEFLSYLLSPGRAWGVPVVLTYRTEQEPTEALTDWLQRLHRDARVHRLDLSALTQAETAEQIALLLGQRAPQHFAERIYRRSEGNAFFTEQLVAFDQTTVEDPTTRDPLPAGLTALLLSRAARVIGPARDVIVALAVAARPMPEYALARLCGTDEAAVREALRDLLLARLLRRPDRAGGHQLRHALLAEAINSELLPGERRELHARVAELMAGWPDSGLAAEIAAHFAEAEIPNEELRWRVLAGREAEAVYASKEAAGHWRRAITLWDQVPEPEAVTGLDLAGLYLRAATAAENAGQGVPATRLAEEALARLAATASPETAVSLYSTVGGFRVIESRQTSYDALAVAIEIGESIPPTPDYVRALHLIARVRADQGYLEEERPLMTRALRAAQQIGHLAEEKLLLVELAWLAMADGDIEDALTGLENAAQIVVDPEDPRAEASATGNHTDVLLKLGELERVVELGLRTIEWADRRGVSNSWQMHLVRSNVCDALTERGDADSAASIIDPVTDGTPTQDSLFVYVARADLDMRRGRLTDAATFWDQHRELLSFASSPQIRFDCALRHIELELWLGEPISALPEAFSVLEVFCGTDASPFAGDLFVLALRACADAAEHARATGDVAELESAVSGAGRLSRLRVAAKVDPFADRRTPVTARADYLSWHAEESRLRGEWDTTAWEQAAAAWDELGRPHRAAYARWRHAQALLGSPHARTAATALLQTAAGQAAQHAPLSNAIADLAHRARIDVTQSDLSQVDEAKQPSAFGLTERELAVLQLLGQGKTNSEIGAELFISAKTASVHVTNILRKLKVNSRVQAAAVAAHAGLLTSAETTDK